ALYLRKTKLPALVVADAFAPGIALGHAIGRIGCFAAGCCWGTECHLPWAVTFRSMAASQLVGVPLGLPLHPAQLYESAAEFVIFGILYWRFGRPHGRGDIISLYLILYGAARFVVEFFRYHEQGNLWGTPLDASQWISLVLIAAGAAHFVVGKRWAKSATGARG
ncbi:MAG: prolipoprotein diacylglyceryl transferase family protein, partial [Bryobacteraceae bacterium]